MWFAVALAAAPGAIGAVALAILVAMMWTARDSVRPGRHETFEVVHRYGGWAALAILTALVVTSNAGVAALVLLAAVVALVAHPWLGVQARPRARSSASPTRS